ncbi:MAG TPA: UDP-2,4-diacetamido-2,4,6-trideoxy-beta-L-altropyranose hydrolase [Gammaproteobacteria bacterium]|nr:UDP-2,4-diacetamido-2,4,6-trideoxy-beta-L-altropyranose hydrolase [Gammaproteobacteria bacterium]
MRIVFRVDASLEIGTGHIMRCLALADALRERGHGIEFICREWPGNLCEHVAAHGHMVHRLPPPAAEPPRATHDAGTAHSHWLGATTAADAAATAAICSRAGMRPPDWLITDHYGIDATWHRILRSATERILAIDDLADRLYDCDVLLDQNLPAEAPERYMARVPAHCEILTGPRYALLRREFAARHRTAAPRETVQTVLVFFGGIDASNHTELALQALAEPDLAALHALVVLGGSNPNRARIEALCASRPNTELAIATPEIAALMARADLAIGAAGSSLWERACLGLPSIAVAVAPNQEEVARAAAATGSVLLLDRTRCSRETFAAAIRTLAAAPATLNAMSRRNLELTDGKGVERVSRILERCPVRLRPARAEDRERVLEWRNAETARRASLDSRHIDPAEHAAWFAATLSSAERRLLIAEVNDEPIGVLRFDFDGATRATASIFLAPAWIGRGYGTAILRAGQAWLAAEYPQVGEVRAEIRPDNAASLQAFRQAGFRLYCHRYVWKPGT